MAKLYFKYGAMGSSKSAQALITQFNYEELGMTVKTINRTIAKLKEQQQIGIASGKVTLSLAQYRAALENNKLTNDFISEKRK